MGSFDLLFGGKRQKNVEVLPDYIWMTKDAKFVGLPHGVPERSNSDTGVILIVTHFPEVLTCLTS